MARKAIVIVLKFYIGKGDIVYWFSIKVKIRNQKKAVREYTTLGEIVYRFFNNDSGVHFYTANETERDAVQELNNFSFEGASYVSAELLTGADVPVYRFLNQDTGVHLYTISETERDAVQELDNFSFEGEVFSAYDTEVEGAIPIYRFFNATTGAHFYSPSEVERDTVETNLSDFESEGIAYYAFPAEI